MKLKESCESRDERVVFPEIGDRQAQGIRQNLGVWDVVPEGEEKARRVERALRNRMVRGRVFDFEKVNGAFIRSFFHRLDHHLLDVHVPLWSETVSKKGLDDIFLLELLNRVPGKLSVEKVQGLGEVLIDGCVVPSVVELAESRQEVFRLLVFRLVDKGFVGY